MSFQKSTGMEILILIEILFCINFLKKITIFNQCLKWNQKLFNLSTSENRIKTQDMNKETHA